MAAPEPTGISETMRGIRKYLVQAKQLDMVNPQVAYFCRSHACQLGLKLKSTPDDLNYVMSLLDWLEANNNVVQHVPQASRQEFVDDFAATLFESADAQDRSTGSTQDTCRTFLAVALIIDVCEQFGQLSEQLSQVRRYATWKAADINRSLKAGMKPQAGGPPDIDPFFDPETAAVMGGNPSNSVPGAHAGPMLQAQHHPQQQSQQQQQQQPKQQSTPTHSNLSSPQHTPHPVVPLTATSTADSITVKGNLLPRDQALAQVDRLCKHAMSAAAFDDIKTATDKLTQALSLLIPHNQ